MGKAGGGEAKVWLKRRHLLNKGPLSLTVREWECQAILRMDGFYRFKRTYMILFRVEFPLRVSEGVRDADSWLPLPQIPVWPPHSEAAGAGAQETDSPTVNLPAPQLAKKELWVASLLWSGCHGNKLSLISSVVTMAIF